MVPSKRIEPENAPETLPEDFADWDGGSSSANNSAVLKDYEVREVAPPAPRERAQAPVPAPPAPAPRRVEAPRPAPTPRPVEAQRPVEAPRPVETPRHAEKGKSGSSRNAAADSDLEAFLRRLSEVNADIAPTPRQEASQPANLWNPPAGSQPAPVSRREPMRAAAEAPAQAAPPERGLFSSVGGGYAAEEDTEEEGGKKPRWGLIGGVAAGVVAVALAITIPMVLRGRSVNQPKPTATTIQNPPVEETVSTPKPSPAGTANTVQTAANNQKPATPNQQVTDSTVATNQPPVSSALMNQQLTAASQVPRGGKSTPEDAPPPAGFGVAGLDGSADTSALGSAFKSETKLKLAPVTVSAGVAGGLLIRKISPVYPSIAKTARVSGTVVLAATISKSGFVTNLQVVNGPPMLRQAALDAVRNWQYRPYMLNNQPTEVTTTINVDFSL